MNQRFNSKKFLKMQNLDNVVHICYEQIGRAELSDCNLSLSIFIASDLYV